MEVIFTDRFLKRVEDCTDNIALDHLPTAIKAFVWIVRSIKYIIIITDILCVNSINNLWVVVPWASLQNREGGGLFFEILEPNLDLEKINIYIHAPIHNASAVSVCRFNDCYGLF